MHAQSASNNILSPMPSAKLTAHECGDACLRSQLSQLFEMPKSLGFEYARPCCTVRRRSKVRPRRSSWWIRARQGERTAPLGCLCLSGATCFGGGAQFLLYRFCNSFLNGPGSRQFSVRASLNSQPSTRGSVRGCSLQRGVVPRPQWCRCPG
jgi:hypothetical protein